MQYYKYKYFPFQMHHIDRMDAVMSEDLQFFLLYAQWKDTIKHISWASKTRIISKNKKKNPQNKQKIEAQISGFIIAVQKQNKQQTHEKSSNQKKPIHPSRYILLSFIYYHWNQSGN